MKLDIKYPFLFKNSLFPNTQTVNMKTNTDELLSNPMFKLHNKIYLMLICNTIENVSEFIEDVAIKKKQSEDYQGLKYQNKYFKYKKKYLELKKTKYINI